MIKGLVYGLAFVMACLFCELAPAQDTPALDRLLAARSQYYIPTTKGLESFHCDASIDWKALAVRLTGTAVPDDDPDLKYAESLRFSILDHLNGQGVLEWTDTVVPLQGEEGADDGLNRLKSWVRSLFQIWNPYMSGLTFPAPDAATVTPTGEGVHLHKISGNQTLDEDFDKNMLLTLAVVDSPAITVSEKPTFVRTDDGLSVSAVTAQMYSPPTARPTEVNVEVEYTKVDSFQLPSHITFAITNGIAIDFSLNPRSAFVSTHRAETCQGSGPIAA